MRAAVPDRASKRIQALRFCCCSGISNELRIGDTAIALGYPLGLKFAANAGIISSTMDLEGPEVLRDRDQVPHCCRLQQHLLHP